MVLSTNLPQSYFTFTTIADSNNAFSSFGFFPGINNEGTVVFSANQDADGRATGIFTSSGGTIATIADTKGFPFSLFANVAEINDYGTIAFRANQDTIGSGIFTYSEGIITTIIDSTRARGVFEDPVINNQETVAFSAAIEGGRGIFTVNDGVTSTIADTNGPFSNFEGYSINDAGTVAFSARLDVGGSGIFTVSNGVTNTIADTDGPFRLLFMSEINNAGTVVFNGFLDGLVGEGIYTIRDGKTTTIADSIGPFRYFDQPAINDAGIVAFKGVLDTGELGIFTGPDPVTDKVIATGDPLLNSTVTNLFFSNQGLNNANQVVFYAQLANGTSGIFRADLNYDDPTYPTNSEPTLAFSL